MIRASLPLVALLVLGGCDRADAPQPASTAAAKAPTEAMRAYGAAASRMHQDMGLPDRDPDVAFARGMIPHHRGAIEMAEIELRYGRDPEMRRLAKAVVDAQDAEIALMERWLAGRSKAPAGTRKADVGPTAGHAH